MKTFTLTAQHITLLRASYVEWQDGETGAAGIDTKRPYGNKNVAHDIHCILNDIPRGGPAVELTEAQERDCLRLHRETVQALQVVLSTGMFIPGTYDCADMTNVWMRRMDRRPTPFADALVTFQEAAQRVRIATLHLQTANEADLPAVRDEAHNASVDLLIIYDRALRQLQLAGITP